MPVRTDMRRDCKGERMETKLRSILEEGILAILPESREQGSFEGLSKSLSKLYDEITLFNPAYGLVNAQGQELVVKHILDCLAPVPIMQEQTSCLGAVCAADLGSGAGLPGLVLASAFPTWSLSLVERMGRRAGFLRNTCAVMGAPKGVQVVQKDLSEVQNKYNVITFRAFRQFKDIVYDLDRILDRQGKVFAYKSSDENIDEELRCLESCLPGAFTAKTIAYEVPFSTAKRQLLVLQRNYS